MFKHDIRQIEKFEDDLKKFAERAYPFATRQTLNDTAFNARERIQAAIDKKFIQRTTFTKRSIGVEKAGTLNVRRQESVVGSTASYMEDQEFGTVKTRRGKEGVPLPTSSASGEGRSARPRRKLPTRGTKLSKIRLRRKAGQDIPAKIFEAARSGRKFVFLDLGRKKGIFRVKGRGRVNESGFITGIQLNMVWDLSRAAVSIPKNPTIFPAAIESQKQQPFFYIKALKFQLKRQGLFKG